MFSATYARATLVGNRVTELPIYGSSCVDAVSTEVNHFILPLVNQIAGEMIHAVCSYYICTFFICMN